MISVVIPSYRRRGFVLQLLESVYQQEGVCFEVIVVDDHSNDGTAEEIALKFPRALVLSQAVNRGPAAARNVGILRAQGEIIVCLDDDATLSDMNTFQRIQELFEENPEVGGWAFRILRPDGVSDDAERWWHPRPIEQYSKQEFETDYFSGTAFAFRRSSLIKAGLFPDEFFQFYEENFLALRFLDNNETIRYSPRVTVLHHAPIGRTSPMRSFYQPRNQVLFALWCYPVFRALKFAVPRVGYNAYVAVRFGHVNNFVKAMVSTLRLGPRILAKRKPVKASTWKRLKTIRKAVR